MENIEVFTGPDCSYCDRAKAALLEHGLAFTEWDISDEKVLAEFRSRLPRVKSIPQIFVDGEHIGGYEDLMLRLGKTI
ncbi:MAG: glutaredoxin domain-containing protein [Geminicoccaceae bacterium]